MTTQNQSPSERRTLSLMQRDTTLFTKLRRARGWSQDYLAKINDPSHDELKDLDTMCEVLHRVKQSGEQIVVMPDFDMDGITSGVLGWAGLSELGFNVQLYVPDYRRGHDIQPEAVDELVEQFPEATTIITCDGGVNSHAGIARGQELGLTMLVTDHHVELPPGSRADVTVNPERMDETYAHPGICGAFVFYQVIQGYAERYAPHQRDNLGLLKLFAGAGTVSDVMPLFYENRQMVRDSLSIARMLYVSIPVADKVTEYDHRTSLLMTLLAADGSHHPAFISAFEGFALCLKAFREHGKLRSIDDLTEEFYGFYLAPAFNSIRRIDGDMHDAFGAFIEQDEQQRWAHIQQVIENNEARKEQTAELMERITTEDQPLAPWAYLTDAPAGMMGLLASNLMNACGHPVIVVNRTDDPNAPRSGSARSPFWFPFISTMTQGGFTAVGHESACGVRMADEQELERFVEHMRDNVQQLHDQAATDGTLAEADRADLLLGPDDDCDDDLNDVEGLLDLARTIEMLRPFGHGFPTPVFDLRVDLSKCHIDVLGQEETHLKIIMRTGMKLLWWNRADALVDLLDLAESPVPGQATVRVRVRLEMSTFHDHTSVNGIIEQIAYKVVDNEEEYL